MRAAAVLITISVFATACVSSAKTYSARDVKSAFRQQGNALKRDRRIERKFHEAVASGQGMVGSMLGRNAPVPDRLFVAANEGDFYVAVFPRPTRPRDVVGDAKALDAVGRQGLAISNRGNVIVVGDESLERRTRAALKGLG